MKDPYKEDIMSWTNLLVLGVVALIGDILILFVPALTKFFIGKDYTGWIVMSLVYGTCILYMVYKHNPGVFIDLEFQPEKKAYFYQSLLYLILAMIVFGITMPIFLLIFSAWIFGVPLF